MVVLEILSMAASIGSFIVAVIALKKIASINNFIVNGNADLVSVHSQKDSSSANQTVKGIKAGGSVQIAARDIDHE